MKSLLVYILPFLSFGIGCIEEPAKTQKKNDNSNNADLSINGKTDSVYMPTGFYYLAGETGGVKMHVQNSDEVYSLAPTYFAGVENIAKTRIDKYGPNIELCLIFDSTGTAKLAEGTGNPLHPKIAVVLTNQLYYVVENNVSIKTGVMCIAIENHNDENLKQLQNTIANKK